MANAPQLTVGLGFDLDEASAKKVVKGMEQLGAYLEKAADDASKKANRTFASSLKETGDRLKNMGQTMSLTVTAPLLLLGNKIKNLASDTNESLNKVDVSFGASADVVKDFANTTFSSLGIARGTALDMAANFGDMATSMGFNTEKAAQMSTTIVRLAGDMASFKNVSIDRANTALSSIFTGETESLKTLGIVMTEANLKTYLLSKGITAQYESMSQSEKVATRLNYILSVTKNSQGDFARTAGSAANMQRKFSESLKELGEKFGQLVLPAFTRAVGLFQNVVTWLGSLNDGTKNVILVFAGLAAVTAPLLLVIGSLSSTIGMFATTFPLLASSIGLVMTSLGGYIIALAALAAVIYSDIKATEQFKKTTQDLELTKKEAHQSVKRDISQMEKWMNVLENTNSTEKQQKKAKEELIKINPDFEKAIKGNTINLNEMNRVAGNTVTQLIRVATAQKLMAQQKAATDAMSELRTGGGLTAGEEFQSWATGIIGAAGSVRGLGMDKRKQLVYDKAIEYANTVRNAGDLLEKEYSDLVGKLNNAESKLGDGIVINPTGGAEKIKNAGFNRLEAFKKMHTEEVKERDKQFFERLEQEKEFALELEKSLSLDGLPTVNLPTLDFNIDKSLKITGLKDTLGGQFSGLSDFLLDNWNDLRSKFNELKLPEFPSMHPVFEKLKINWQDGISDAEAAMIKKFLSLKDVLSGVMSIVSNSLGDAFSGAFESIFDKDVKFDFKKVLGSFLKAMGQMVSTIGSAILAAGIGLSASVFGMGEGAKSIAAGVGLIALGGALMGGGSAIGNKSNVSPSENSSYQSQYKGAIGGSQGGFDGGKVVFELQGTTLRGVLNNTDKLHG